MDERNINPEVPKILEGQEINVYVPIAAASTTGTPSKAGIASFDEDHFNVVSGEVSLKSDYADLPDVKVDKFTNTEDYDRLYGREADANGDATDGIRADVTTQSNSIVKRDGSGGVLGTNPTDLADVQDTLLINKGSFTTEQNRVNTQLDGKVSKFSGTSNDLRLYSRPAGVSSDDATIPKISPDGSTIAYRNADGSLYGKNNSSDGSGSTWQADTLLINNKTFTTAVTGIEGNISTINSQINTIDSSLDSHDNRLDSLESDTEQLQTDLNTAEGQISAINTTIGSHGTKLGNLEADVDELRDDIDDILGSKGQANGIATLGNDGKVPSSQLPSYVDNIVEAYYYNGNFYSDVQHTQQITPEDHKIYVDIPSGKTYRWSGTQYTEISSSLALGITHETAGYGDWTEQAYNNSYRKNETYNKNEVYAKEETYSQTEVDNLLADKIDKNTTIPTGNLIVVDANDAIADSGISKDKVAINDQYNDHMGVRYAKQLISPDGITESLETFPTKNPFIYRPTHGGESISDDLGAIKQIRGKTYKWSQLLDFENSTVTRSGLTITYAKSDLSITINGTAASDVFEEFTIDWTSLVGKLFFGAVGLDNNCYFGYIAGTAYPGAEFSIDDFEALGFGLIFKSGATFSNKKIYPKIVNLTTLYGSGNEPTTPEQFLKEYPIFYGSVPYTEGTISSIKPASLATVGFNAFNPTTGKAFLLGGNEYQITGAYTALSYSTGETITPDADGKFTPAKNGELTVTGGNSTTTCVHLTWSGYRDGEYESYWRESISTHVADYFADGMHGVGGVYDELTPTKAIKRFGIVDLGTLNWTYVQDPGGVGHHERFYAVLSSAKIGTTSILCTKYPRDSYGNIFTDVNDKRIAISTQNSQVAVYDTSFTDATAFKAAMSGVYLVYELATPVETEIDPSLNFNYRVSDFGTEEFVFPANYTPMPVPATLFYQTNLVDKLRNINELTSTQMTNILSALD